MTPVRGTAELSGSGYGSAMSARSNRRGRIVGSTAAAFVALVAVFGGTLAPASAQPPEPVARYVALGDSYAAGQGAGLPLDECLRSTAAYPVLLDAEPRTNLLRQASCSGDTIAEVAATQLSQVNRGTTLVTLTVGANDLGAGAAYAACTIPPYEGCAELAAAALAKLDSGEISTDLDALIDAIAERAPNAHIVVTDYPIPFSPLVQDPLAQQVNLLVAGLNAQITQAVLTNAATVDVELATVVPTFLGHGIGGGDSWLGENLADPLTFLHPTAVGQDAYRDVIVAVLAN